MHQGRLITLFDEKPDIPLQDKDVIITNDDSLCDSNHKIVHINRVDYVDKDGVLLKSIRETLSLLPEEYHMMHNSIYHMMLRPIIHALVTIDRVIRQEKINEIWLFGGNETPFLTMNNAEGEGVKKQYHSSWLYNSVIYQYFSTDKTIKIQWKKKTSKFAHWMLYRVREQSKYYRRTLGYIIRDFHTPNQTNICINKEKRAVVALAELDLQYKHLAKVIADISKYEKLFILGRRINPSSNDLVCYLPSLSVASILKVMSRIRNANTQNKTIHFLLNGRSVVLPINRIMMGSKERLFITLYQEEALSRLLQILGPERVQCVCTNRTMGADICYVHNVCKKYKLLHVNFQYVAMPEILYPEMDVADRYYLYSKKTYDLYRAYGSQYEFYLPLEREALSEKATEGKRIVIFTQPDTYTDRYLVAIKAILSLFQEKHSHIEIIIKLHYRQDKVDDFLACQKYYNYAKIMPTGNAGEIMRECDCVISMTSSVLFEALLQGIPAMILDFDGLDRTFIEESDVCVPEVNYVVHSPQEVFDLLYDYSKFYHEYKKRLEKFVIKHHVQMMETTKCLEAKQSEIC